jgi:hypothetical protein
VTADVRENARSAAVLGGWRLLGDHRLRRADLIVLHAHQVG